MERICIKAGRFHFVARFESERAPKTCAKFRSMLPYKERIIHLRWSGDACWIPLGELDLGLGYENQTSYRRSAKSSSIRCFVALRLLAMKCTARGSALFHASLDVCSSIFPAYPWHLRSFADLTQT